MSTQTAVKKLFELRTVLDRLSQTDSTLYEAISQDVEEAIRLADESIAELAGEGDSDAAQEQAGGAL